MKHDQIKFVAKRLRSEGKTYQQIGNILNLSMHSARGLCVNIQRLNPMKSGRKIFLTKFEKLKGPFHIF